MLMSLKTGFVNKTKMNFDKNLNSIISKKEKFYEERKFSEFVQVLDDFLNSNPDLTSGLKSRALNDRLIHRTYIVRHQFSH